GADAVDEDLRAAPGNGVQPGVSEPRERLPDRQPRGPGDALPRARPERMQVDRVAAPDRAEQVLVVVDPEIGMVAALHEHAGTAGRERLLDFLEDHRLRQEVALARVARRSEER